MVTPIGPDDVVANRGVTTIPQAVILAFNRLIEGRWDGVQARFTRSDAVGAIWAATGLCEQEMLHARHLDIEPLYRDAGWKVTYEAPEIGETWEAHYVFEVR